MIDGIKQDRCVIVDRGYGAAILFNAKYVLRKQAESLSISQIANDQKSANFYLIDV